MTVTRRDLSPTPLKDHAVRLFEIICMVTRKINNLITGLQMYVCFVTVCVCGNMRVDAVKPRRLFPCLV